MSDAGNERRERYERLNQVVETRLRLHTAAYGLEAAGKRARPEMARTIQLLFVQVTGLVDELRREEERMRTP